MLVLKMPIITITFETKFIVSGRWRLVKWKEDGRRE
jgi:hypothetical protein